MTPSAVLEASRSAPAIDVHPPPEPPTLEVREVTRRFGDRVAADRVSLKLRRGEFVALLGPNGAGKSTLLRLIAGRLRPDSGQISIDGEDVTRTRRRAARSVGAVIDPETAWFPRLGGLENLRLFGVVGGVSRGRIDAIAAAELERAGLADVAGLPVAAYSRGMRARLGIARARLGDPPLLLLDEPSHGLDAAARTELMDVLARERDERAVLLATHDTEEAAVLADRALVLRAGRVEAHLIGPFDAAGIARSLNGRS